MLTSGPQKLRRILAAFFLSVIAIHGGAEIAVLTQRCVRTARMEAALAARREAAQQQHQQQQAAQEKFLGKVALADLVAPATDDAATDEEDDEDGSVRSCCAGDAAGAAPAAAAVDHCGQVAAATEPAPVPCMCHCAHCGDSCPNGANCRCSRGAPDYGITGFIIDIPGCHTGGPAADAAAFPQSMMFRFLPPPVSLAATSSQPAGELSLLAPATAVDDRREKPPTPPPKSPIPTA